MLIAGRWIMFLFTYLPAWVVTYALTLGDTDRAAHLARRFQTLAGVVMLGLTVVAVMAGYGQRQNIAPDRQPGADCYQTHAMAPNTGTATFCKDAGGVYQMVRFDP